MGMNAAFHIVLPLLETLRHWMLFHDILDNLCQHLFKSQEESIRVEGFAQGDEVPCGDFVLTLLQTGIQKKNGDTAEFSVKRKAGIQLETVHVWQAII